MIDFTRIRRHARLLLPSLIVVFGLACSERTQPAGHQDDAGIVKDAMTAGPQASALVPSNPSLLLADAGMASPDLFLGSKSFATSISSLANFRQFSEQPGGLVRTGEVIKFLIDNRTYPEPEPPIYYINSQFTDGGAEPVSWVALHREWAEQALDGFSYSLKKFSRTAYFTTSLKTREFISGRIQTFEKDGSLFFGVWFVEMDLISEEMLQFALAQVVRSFRVSEHPLHFVAYSSHQTSERIAPWLATNGFVVHQLSDLLADVPFQSLNVGEAWGYLRVAPDDPGALEANEIPVFETLPLDLGVVAGTITTAFQDVASHVNIKAKQRKTPNLMLRDKAEISRLKKMDGQPVHLTVTQDGYRFEPTTATLVESKLESLLSARRWRTPPADFTNTIVAFDAMCRGQNPAACLALSSRFGGKAAGLGFLAHKNVIGIGSKMQKKLGYGLSPLGFAVSISNYEEFVAFNGKRDPAFKARLEKLMTAESGAKGTTELTGIQRRELIKEIQASFLAAPFPPGMYAKLAAQVKSLKHDYAKRFPGQVLTKLKIRSSANVEDIPSFNGAGLHNSFSAKLSKSLASEADAPCKIEEKKESHKVKRSMQPKSLACAVKATYASLWNLRAVRERTFRRFDNRGAYMGLAVVPSYKHKKKSPQGKIATNAVLFTRVLNAPTVYGYQLSTQIGGNLATNPDPNTLAELTALTFQLKSVPAPTVLQYAVPVAGQPKRTRPILSDKQMRNIVAIARSVEEAYCAAKPNYFFVNGIHRKCHQVSNSQEKPSALDLEIKTYDNGEILFKQVREFDGR